MIPDFPNFKYLELSDKTDIDNFTNEFIPYSDFNFASMWSWDIKNSVQVSVLNENLVVLFSDYLTGKPFVSFIGKTKLPETSIDLLNFSKKKYKSNSLRLIPESVAHGLFKSSLRVKVDMDSSDYVFSIKDLVNMNTWPNHTSGQKIRNFIKKYPNYAIKVSRSDEINESEYINIFNIWAKNKNIENFLELNEFKAFKRFMQIKNENISFISLYVDNVLIGFTAFEILFREYAISHFIKANTTDYPYSYDILNWEEAKILDSRNIKYYNWEQDLGIKGLRFSKEKYKPSFFLKKYIVKKRSIGGFLLNILNIKL